MSRCLLARARLARYVADLKESTSAEKVGTAVKAGYLANVKSTERNIIGNTFQGLADLSVRNIASAIDYAQALGRSAMTGGRMKPHEFREIASTLNIPGLKAGGTGLKEGLAQAIEIMRTGLDANAEMEKFNHTQTHFKNPVLDKLTRGIFTFMEAQDKPFYQFAFKTSLYSRARLAGIRAGLKGARLTEYVDYALANPTEDMVLGAHHDAAYSTYKNATNLSEFASDARRGLQQRAAKAPPGRKVGIKAAQILMDITLPFTRVAGAIAHVAVDYSPAGFLKTVAHAMDRDPLVQREITQRLIKASAGTGLLMWGYYAAQNGNATGSYPKSAAERRRWDLEGKGANMVKIGNEWHSVSIFGPLAIPFLVGANVEAAGGIGWKEKATMTAAFMGQTLTEMTFLSGIANLVNALTDPNSKGAAAIASTVAPLPSILPQLAQATDPVQRQAKSVGDKIKAKLPGLSKTLPARLDAFGDTVTKAGGPRAVLDATAGRKVTESELTRELDRLDINPGGISPTFKQGKEKVTRTPEEQNSVTQEFGPIRRAVLQAVLGDPEYQKLGDDEKKLTLERVIRTINDTQNRVDKARRAGEKVPRLTPEAFLSGAAINQ